MDASRLTHVWLGALVVALPLMLCAPVAASAKTWHAVLAGPANGTNYTVTTDATLYEGEGFGIWLRANKEVSAIKYSCGVTIPIVPPAEGSYGLHAWGSSTVRFWQTTAGPPI
jgi:hypothetical protein